MDDLQADFARWELARGRCGSACMERRRHSIGMPTPFGVWLADFRSAGPASLAFEHTGGPPALTRERQAPPQAAGIERTGTGTW
ncbi:MAG: hypothetical protein M1118_00300 [Chloroflexi bacterium]|nr:hypothetical protein [Chloroflexota bacterium]